MSAIFTQSDAIDMSKERDWPAKLGMLDWDDTSIVFTKRSLIEFLKYAGITVDTNFNNISKLPRYAKFGKLSTPEFKSAPDSAGDAADAFRPSRRVRDVPGGHHTDIFATVDDDALSTAPRKEGSDDVHAANIPATAPLDNEAEHEGIDFGSSFKPSRRVRETPGGHSNLSNFWDSEQTEEFKPTRRVRERPGGQDNISGIF